MKRIGFFLAGEGRGHAARVVALSQVLRDRYEIVYLRTLVTTIRQFKSRKRDIAEIAERICELRLTVLISDFEPYASWAAARWDLPVLNLNYPGVILKFLSFSPGAWVAQAVATMMVPPAQKTLIWSFYRD